MNHKLFTTLSGLSISSALLMAGLMAFGQAPRLSGAVDDSQLVDTIETGALQATEEAVAAEGTQTPPQSHPALDALFFLRPIIASRGAEP